MLISVYKSADNGSKMAHEGNRKWLYLNGIRLQGKPNVASIFMEHLTILML